LASISGSGASGAAGKTVADDLLGLLAPRGLGRVDAVGHRSPPRSGRGSQRRVQFDLPDADKRERLIRLEERWLNELTALCGPGES
jgi:hypothetical protein